MAIMSPSSPPPPQLGDNYQISFITPRVGHEQGSSRLLSPPPAPKGCVYDERDVLLNPYFEGSQESSFPLSLQNLDLVQDRNQIENPSRRIRANSFDNPPCPKILLRPRFTRNTYRHLSNVIHEQGCSCSNCKTENSQPTHLRSHTYDSSSILDKVFAPETHSMQPPLLPSIPSGLDVSQLGHDLPCLTPSRSTFVSPGTPVHLGRIPKPVARYYIRGRSSPPPNERRFNTSEATTSCTLSLSSQSAFGTPLKGKNPNSPLSCSGSDSASPDNPWNRDQCLKGVQAHKMKIQSGLRGTLPLFPPQPDGEDNYFSMNQPIFNNKLASNAFPPFNVVPLGIEFDQRKNNDLGSETKVHCWDDRKLQEDLEKNKEESSSDEDLCYHRADITEKRGK